MTALLLAAWKFLRSIPWQVWAIIAVIAAVWWYGEMRYARGQADVQRRWDSAVADQAAADALIVPKQAAVTERVVTKYVDRVRLVREKGATITREVPRYVTSADCPLSAGFRVLHDASAAGEVPDPAAVADAAAVPAATAAETVVGNYFSCHETAERLSSLQAWVRYQATITGTD